MKHSKLNIAVSWTLAIILYPFINIIAYLWKNKTNWQVLFKILLAVIISLFAINILMNAKPFVEAPEGQKGMITIKEDGFVAKYLVQEAEASENLTFGSYLIDEIKNNKDFSKPFYSSYDVNRLVRAIGMHETKGCTIGSGRTHNNPGGVMTWATGARKFKYYNSCEEGYNDMVRIWRRYYKDFPNLRLAKKWSGSDRANAWLNNVTYFYNTI